MKPEQLSSLSRVVDPRYSSNRLAIAGATTAALMVVVASLVGFDVDGGPLAAAVGVFLAWAIARELDPDHTASAAIAIPLSFVFLLVLGPASLLVSTGVLLGTRMAAGTVGTALRPLDIGGIIVVSGLLGTNMVGAVGVAAMIVGILVGEPRRARGIGIAVAAAAAFTVVGIVSDMERSWAAPDTTDWIIAAVTIISMLVAIPAPSPTSSTDRDSGILLRWRVTVARAVAGLAVVAGLVIVGGSGAAALAATVTAALAGTAIRQLASGLNRANDRGAESRQTVRW
ncbi:MAG: hypothetical protein WBN24_08590 [Acidimicrobiia bacterium]